jgi:hypothetical protein
MSIQSDDENGARKTKADTGVTRFLSWYGNRKRKAMANDATLSFRQFLVKIGLLFVFILVDLIFFPSLVQIFLPISIDFFIAWAVGGLVLVLAEKYLLERILTPRTSIRSSSKISVERI